MRVSRRMILALQAATIVSAVITGSRDAGVVDECPRCLTQSLVALQTATSDSEVREIVEQPGFDLAGLMWNVRADYALMLCYAGLFAYYGWMTRKRRVRGARIAGWMLMVAAGVALAADFSENRALMQVMNGTGDVGWLRSCSLVKWGAFGVAAGAQFWTFLPKWEGPIYLLASWGVAWLCLIAGTLAIWGVFDNRKLEVCLFPFVAAVPVQLLIIAAFWENYKSCFRADAKA